MLTTHTVANRRLFIALVWLFLACCFDVSYVVAGKLVSVGEAVRKNDSSSDSQESERKRKHRNRNRSRRDCNNDSLNWITIFADDSSNTVSSTEYRNSSCSSSTAYASASSQSITRAINEDHWFSRLSLFGGSDSETLKHGGFSWLGQIPGAFGLDVGATNFRESIGSLRETMWLGDVNFVFEPIIGAVRGRIGVGINWLNDSGGTETGGNITAGFDLPIFEYLMTTGEVDFGSIGDASYSHGQITLGVQLGGAEVFAGYNKYDIGGVELDGTIFGVRFRL